MRYIIFSWSAIMVILATKSVHAAECRADETARNWAFQQWAALKPAPVFLQSKVYRQLPLCFSANASAEFEQAVVAESLNEPIAGGGLIYFKGQPPSDLLKHNRTVLAQHWAPRGAGVTKAYSVSFKLTPLRDVLDFLDSACDLNLAAAPDLYASFTLHFEHTENGLHWCDVMAEALATEGLELNIADGVLVLERFD